MASAAQYRHLCQNPFDGLEFLCSAKLVDEDIVGRKVVIKPLLFCGIVEDVQRFLKVLFFSY